MTLSDHEQLNTVADWFDVQFRYFAGPNYGMMTKDGIKATLEPWTSPDSPLLSWTEITDRIAYASKFAYTQQGNSLVWTADISGWNYDDALLNLGLSLVCWRRFWRPAGNQQMYGPNLVTNGGFETFIGTSNDGIADTFDGWGVAGGGNSEASATRHSGEIALKMSWTGGDSPKINSWPAEIAVTPGEIYRLRFWTRGDGNSRATCAIYNAIDGTWILSPWEDTSASGTSWQEVVISFSIPANCNHIVLFFSIATYGEIFIDDIVVEALEPATASAGWQDWKMAYVGEIISRADRNNYQNGKAWQRTVTGLNYHLSNINAPRVTAGRIRVTEGAGVTGNEPLAQVVEERDTGEFVGGRANVDLANITDGNRNTVYISETIPGGAAVPFPTPLWDGAVLPSELFIKPFPGWPLDRAWWVEAYNARSQTGRAAVGFSAATWESGAPVYQFSNTGESWSELTSGRAAIFCAHRKTFDELTGGDNNGAEWIVDLSQFANIHLTNDAAMRVGGAVVAWAPGGASRDYVFNTKYGPVEWHGPTLDSALLSAGESFLNSLAGLSAAVGNWSVNPYPHPGANGTGEGPVWFKVLLPENVCETLDEVSASSTTIRLDNYRGWVRRIGWSPAKGIIGSNVFNWTYRDENGLHGVSWVNAPAAPIPANTRCYPYANGLAQTGYPLTAAHLVRRKQPTIESYRLYASAFDARAYTEAGWQQDYYAAGKRAVQGNTQKLRLSDSLSDGENGYLWVRSLLYLIDRMTDGGRAKINEVEVDIAETALDLPGTAALDGQNSAALARYLTVDWTGVAAGDFVDASFEGAHLMGEHALAITPVDRVLDDLAGGTGCLVDFAPTGGVVWREDAWWPKNGAAPETVWAFDGDAYRGDVETQQVPAQVDYLILNALSLEGGAHTLRVVYPTPLGTSEPPVWAMVREVNDRIVALDSDAGLVAQIELEKLTLSNRGARLTVKGPGEWARPGLRVGLYFDYAGAGAQYRTWLIQAVNTTLGESNGQRTYQTDLELTAFRG